MPSQFYILTLLGVLLVAAHSSTASPHTAVCFISSTAKSRHRNHIAGLPERQKQNEKPTRTSTTSLSLFFRARGEESLKQRRKEAQARLPANIFQELSSGNAPIPYTVSLVEQSSNSATTDHHHHPTQPLITIRLLTSTDLDTVVSLCVAEFGGGATSIETLMADFPWRKKPNEMKQYLVDWLENFALPAVIYWTFRLKIVPKDPQDHALLVATQQYTSKQQSSKCNTYTINSKINHDVDNRIVGLVEISKQPPDGKRNPPAYPLPLWYKQWYCLQNQLPSLNGWVTNLLVSPEFRGQGYSKLLMAAAEGVARRWGCTMIHLHCDADTVSGRVPQTLYKNLGYEAVEDENSPFGWMGTELRNKIFMVEGVPLLYFRKTLSDESCPSS